MNQRLQQYLQKTTNLRKSQFLYYTVPFLCRKPSEKENISLRITPCRAHPFLKLLSRFVFVPKTGRKDMFVPLVPTSVDHLCQSGIPIRALEVIV